MSLGRRVRDLVRRFGARPHPSPVFVLGNQKAGTTAVAALLGAATGLDATLDFFHRLPPDELPALLERRATLEDLVRRHAFAFATPVIKEPQLTFLYGDLARVFPQARFAFVLRDPRDNLRSILNRLALPGTLTTLDEAQRQALAGLPGWRLILDGRLFATAGAGVIETLALRWNRALEIHEAAAPRMVLLRYEDFMRDKIGSIAALARAVGLDPRHDISKLTDVDFQPRGDRGAKWADFFGVTNLALIERVCGPGMARHGYPEGSS